MFGSSRIKREPQEARFEPQHSASPPASPSFPNESAMGMSGANAKMGNLSLHRAPLEHTQEARGGNSGRARKPKKRRQQHQKRNHRRNSCEWPYEAACTGCNKELKMKKDMKEHKDLRVLLCMGCHTKTKPPPYRGSDGDLELCKSFFHPPPFLTPHAPAFTSPTLS